MKKYKSTKVQKYKSIGVRGLFYFFTLALFYFPPPAEAAITLVQQVSGDLGTTEPALTVTAGNLVVAVIFFNDSGAVNVTAVTPNSQTFVSASAQRRNTATGVTAEIWYLANAPAGTYTFKSGAPATVSFSAGVSGRTGHIFEFAGATTTSVLDVAAAGSTGNGTAPSQTLSSVSANSLMVSVVTSSGGNATNPSGWSSGGTVCSNFNCTTSYKLDSGTAGNQTITWGSIANWAINSASFKSTGGGGGGTPSAVVHRRIQ